MLSPPRREPPEAGNISTYPAELRTLLDESDDNCNDHADPDREYEVIEPIDGEYMGDSATVEKFQSPHAVNPPAAECLFESEHNKVGGESLGHEVERGANEVEGTNGWVDGRASSDIC